MKKKLLNKAPAQSTDKDVKETLIINLDENRKWKVDIQDNNGYIIKSNMRYSEKEMFDNYDLKIEVHQHNDDDEDQ